MVCRTLIYVTLHTTNIFVCGFKNYHFAKIHKPTNNRDLKLNKEIKILLDGVL